MEELTSHGNVSGRKTVLEILEAGLKATDPYEYTRKFIRLKGKKLIVGSNDTAGCETLVFDLSNVGDIYVVGGGKAAQSMAKAIEDALGELITEGHINAKKGEEVKLRRIEVTLAGHPIPDEDSVEGSKRILEIEKKAKKGDIVFFSESGGGSALMALPGPGLTLEDLQEVTRKLYFECGASMWDTNAVRWQLMILRGRHGRYVGDATLIGFHVDERPPGIKVHSRQVGVDIFGSYRDAIRVLKRYGIWNEVPQSVRAYLENADPRYGPIKPGELDGKPQFHFRVMGPENMLEAARKKSEELGLNPAIVASNLSDVEAQAAGQIISYIAQEIEVYRRPFKPPSVLLCGGELIVTVGEASGKGGRNQEFVLSTALKIDESENIVVASADSDGMDGPTDAAGGIVDGYTLERAKEAGVDVLAELSDHNSYEALKKIGDTIITGVRGTNVQDLRLIYVGKGAISRNRLVSTSYWWGKEC